MLSARRAVVSARSADFVLGFCCFQRVAQRGFFKNGGCVFHARSADVLGGLVFSARSAGVPAHSAKK